MRVIQQTESVEWHATRIRDPIKRLRYLRRAARQEPEPRRRAWSWSAAALCAVLMLIAVRSASDATGLRSAPAPVKAKSAPARAADVWLVEKSPAYELYSNGLRIETRFTVSSRPRSFIAFDRRDRDLSPGLWASDPVGIVYHTSESHSAPFEPGQNQVIKRQGEALLEFVRQKRAYHFVIDRFGRVHRIVAETDTAHHAGNSVWADAKWVYINLNTSFLGISFEGETQDLKENLTPAQIHAGRVLTEMLRSRYRIAR